MSKQSNLLDTEQRFSPLVVLALTISALSGYATYFVGGLGHWKQWTYLLHALSGTYLAVAILPYVFIHFYRTLGLRRVVVIIFGWLTALCVLAMIASGGYVLIFGQTEALRWVHTVHVWTAHATVTLIIAHLAAHLLLFSEKQRTRRDPLMTLSPAFIKTNVVGVFISLSLVAIATIAYDAMYTQPPEARPDYTYPYGPGPFLPSQTQTQSEGFVAQSQIARSESCASCHLEVTQQWLSSLHAQAASDDAYERNIDLLVKARGIEAARYCEGCHAPVALLTGQLTPGGVHGGIADTPANQEGVSCLTCHGTTEVVHLKGVGSYRFAPSNGYLFADSESDVLSKLHNFLIRINPSAHRATMSRAVLKRPELCATCHVQFMDKDMNNWGWVKMQDDYDSWLKSHYSGQAHNTFSRPDVVRCQDCHMPLVNAGDPSSDTQGKVRSHRWPGANTIIPALNGDREQSFQVERFLQSDKIRLKIEQPARVDAVRAKQYSDTTFVGTPEAPYYLYLGESATLKVAITNVGVGHAFPAGTTDINEVWVHLRVVDAQNKVVYESGALDDAGFVDPKALFYKSVPIDRHGKEVWKHDLFNMTGISYKRVIDAGETDLLTYRLAVPYWAKSPLTVSAVLRYRKFNRRYADWALGDINIDLPVVDMARDALLIPVQYKARVE